MKHGQFNELNDLAAEITRRAKFRADYIVDPKKMRLSATASGLIGITSAISGVGAHTHYVNNLAMQQIGTFTGIPKAYVEKMREQAPSLLAENVNTWLQRAEGNRMLRTIDGTADAFLSASYKRIDNYPVANAILPVLNEAQVKFESCDVTDTHMFMKVVSPRLQGDVKVGDPVQMGLVISNSEVGLGSLKVQPMIYRLVCLNGMIVPRAFGEGVSRVHRGQKQDLGVIYAADTLMADARAISLMIRDTVQQLLSPKAFEAKLEELRGLTERRIEGNPNEAVLSMGKMLGITQDECGGVLRHLVEGGDLSQWGLANAVTAFAQEDDLSYNRATELEEIGGKIVELRPNQWKIIQEAA